MFGRRPFKCLTVHVVLDGSFEPDSQLCLTKLLKVIPKVANENQNNFVVKKRLVNWSQNMLFAV